MEAAFVEIGLEKNGFLFVDEIVGPELEGKRPRGRRITDLISRGEEVLVQAVKDPMKTKGARLTTEISLPGRFVVYVPNGDTGLGVSRRLEDDERNRLKEVLKNIAPKQGGVIVRTAAEGASAEDIKLDLDFLMKLWKPIQAKAKSSKAPTLLFEEAELPLRVTRDLFTGDFEKALVDDDKTLKRIQGYLKKTSPHMAERVHRYRPEDKTPLFEAYGVDAEIRSTLSRRVDLPSGGYLIFDYAEAFTVIDVNTGRFVGSRSKSSGARLEDTVTKNNLEAVKEVVRQLRLRDIGGIIVIDFIDMANPKNREAVEQALQQELERDRTKTYVVEISPLGLVEMTRQNVTDGPREILTRKCPTCAGEGVVISEQTAVVDAERRLRALAASKPRTKAFAVELNAHVADLLVGPGAAQLAEFEAATKRRYFLDRQGGRARRALHGARRGHDREAHARRFRGEGGRDDRAEARRGRPPRRPHGRRQGRQPVDQRRRRGEARRQEGVCPDRARENGTAYASLAGGARAPTAEPITAEAQAEKPTRASRAKKPETDHVSETEVSETEAIDAEAIAEEDEVEGIDEVGEVDEVAEEAPAAGDAPPKKRTRRGSRGGRGRTKKPAVATETSETVAGEPVSETEVSETEARADGAPPKKKTRRGSRGGRGRTRPATAGAAAAAETNGAGEPPEAVRPTIHVPDETLGSENGAETNGDQPAAPRKKTRRGSRGGRRRRKPAGTGTAATVETPPSDEG